MSREFPQLDGLRLTMDEETRASQMAAVDQAIREQRTPRVRRFRLLAIAAAAVLLLPTIALAAEDSIPGDILYPVKRVLEPVVALFDTDVVADRRIDEARELFQREAELEMIERHVDEAREAVDRLAEEDGSTTDAARDAVRDLEQRLQHRFQEEGDDRPREEDAGSDQTLDGPVDHPGGSDTDDGAVPEGDRSTDDRGLDGGGDRGDHP